jgi:anthranilate phosphoribosyltransferase
MQRWIKQTAKGKKRAEDLSYEEASAAAEAIASGHSTDAQTAAILISERLKTESPEEALAFAETFRKHSCSIPVPQALKQKLVDFGGPYTGRKTFAATIPSSLLLAEMGLPVYLHSSDALPPRYGTPLKDIVAELGISLKTGPVRTAENLEEAGIGFGETEELCPPLASLRKIRKELGVRTLLNTTEKIISPPGAENIMTGIFHRTVVDTNARLLRALGYKNMYMVQGVEGSEDLPVHRKSFLYHVTERETRCIDIDPKEAGIAAGRNKMMENLTLTEQADLIIQVLEGKGHSTEKGKYAHLLTTYNTGVRCYLFGLTPTICDGIQLAEKKLEAGKGLQQLKLWRELSNEAHFTDRPREQRQRRNCPV